MMQKSPVEEVRTRSIPYLLRTKDKNIFPTLLTRLKNTTEMSIKEALLLGKPGETQTQTRKNKNGGLGSSQGLITLGSVRDHQQYAAVKASLFDTRKKQCG